MTIDSIKKWSLVELHTHVGFSVSPSFLWELAHDQGILLPTKDYHEFVKLVTIRKAKPYEEYLQMYDLTEKIQSSPEALFMAMQYAIADAYRKSNVRQIELRFNPILRNRNGERDLDHLIVFALQGMERAMLKYPVKAGIILMMDRRFTLQQNTAIVDKAIKYQSRGIVGIDLAGPIQKTNGSNNFQPKDISAIVTRAKLAGLGITVHTGEATDASEMWQVLEHLKPDRIGHGIACRYDSELMKAIVDLDLVLEICPTSNVNTKILPSYQSLSALFSVLHKHQVKYTINTDGPEMQRITLRSEYQQLVKKEILTLAQLFNAREIAEQSSFIGKAR